MNNFYKKTSGLHNGIDFGAPAETPILAGLRGRIEGQSGDATPNVVVTSGNYTITYGHVDMAPTLKVGDEVFPDTIIGKVHDQKDNSHLHLSVRQSDRFYNPLSFFREDSIKRFDWGPYDVGENALSMRSYLIKDIDKANYWKDPKSDILGIVR